MGECTPNTMDYRQTLFSCQRTNVLSYREAVSFNTQQWDTEIRHKINQNIFSLEVLYYNTCRMTIRNGYSIPRTDSFQLSSL